MMYELLDTNAHPLVVVATLDDLDHAEHPTDCPCGGSAGKALRVAVGGNAAPALKAAGLLGAVAELMADDGTSNDECRMIRRSLAKLLEVTS